MIYGIIRAFLAILVAELGDKTQLAVIGFAASGRPVETFIGASLALVLITAIGSAVGAGIGKVVPQKTIQIAAGTLFIAIGIVYLIRGFK